MICSARVRERRARNRYKGLKTSSSLDGSRVRKMAVASLLIGAAPEGRRAIHCSEETNRPILVFGGLASES